MQIGMFRIISDRMNPPARRSTTPDWHKKGAVRAVGSTQLKSEAIQIEPMDTLVIPVGPLTERRQLRTHRLLQSSWSCERPQDSHAYQPALVRTGRTNGLHERLQGLPRWDRSDATMAARRLFILVQPANFDSHPFTYEEVRRYPSVRLELDLLLSYASVAQVVGCDSLGLVHFLNQRRVDGIRGAYTVRLEGPRRHGRDGVHADTATYRSDQCVSKLLYFASATTAT